MASRSRSISPVGASRFERPYTLPQRAVVLSDQRSSHKPPTLPLHHREISRSTWSSTTDSSPVRGYSTAPTSTQQSPVDRRGLHLKEVDTWPAQHDVHDHHAEEFDNEEWYAHFNAYDSCYDEGYGDDCPDQATLAEVQDIPIYTADGRQLPFGSLFRPETAINQRQLFVFIRHFYCGACQAYLKAITDGISTQDYFSIPIPTSIIVIGCGSPHLIPFYKAVTGTSYPIFAEPSRQLYKKLGMVLSSKIGRERPEYMRDISNHAWLAGQVKTVREGLRARKSIRKTRRLVGGFDMLNDAASPRASSTFSGMSMRPTLNSEDDYGNVSIRRQFVDASPHDHDGQLAALSLRKRDLVRGGNMFQIGGEFLFEDGEVIWCHRMRHYRDHVEVADIRRLLELDDAEEYPPTQELHSPVL